MKKISQPKRSYMNAQRQEITKQNLYYKNNESSIDINKLNELGLRVSITKIKNESSHSNIRMGIPKFYYKETLIPNARDWNEVITWHFYNVFCKKGE